MKKLQRLHLFIINIAIPGVNLNFNIAEATAYFPKSWIKDALYAQSCPPKCTNRKKPKGSTDDKSTEIQNEDSISQIDMGHLLLQLDDQENLALWNARPGWLSNNHKKYIEEDCPSFKEMRDQNVFNDMENIATQLRIGKSCKSCSIIILLYNLYFLDYPEVPEDYDFCEIQLWDVNGKTNFPRLLPNLKTTIDKR